MAPHGHGSNVMKSQSSFDFRRDITGILDNQGIRPSQATLRLNQATQQDNQDTLARSRDTLQEPCLLPLDTLEGLPLTLEVLLPHIPVLHQLILEVHLHRMDNRARVKLIASLWTNSPGFVLSSNRSL